MNYVMKVESVWVGHKIALLLLSISKLNNVMYYDALSGLYFGKPK